jgi:hypothetical protein
LLGVLARPGTALVAADRRTRALAARGLVREAVDGGLVHITPAGLRALATAAERGLLRLEPELPARPE